MRLLLTPFPQEEFNQTEDRKSADQSLGVTCLDCHSNFHTNAAFHLTPDVRPQADRFRLDTTSLRGLFNQQIHGSKRSLRSVEDFTQFEQRTAYFNGDHVSAHAQGREPARPHEPGRDDGADAKHHRLPAGSEARSLWDVSIPPRRPSRSSPASSCSWARASAPSATFPQTAFMDNNMHDLKLERFYKIGQTANDLVELPDGPIKTFTLRGIKDSPPYLHDGRLLTLADTVEFFNLVLGLKLTQQEKTDLVAYLLTL